MTNEPEKRMNINIPLSLHNAFKAATASNGVKMTDVLEEFIEEYAKKHGTLSKKAAKKGGR